MERDLRKVRPDLIGAVVAWHGDGGFTQAAYFVSETEARKNERVTAGSDLAEQFAALIDGDPTFYDLREPDFAVGRRGGPTERAAATGGPLRRYPERAARSLPGFPLGVHSSTAGCRPARFRRSVAS